MSKRIALIISVAGVALFYLMDKSVEIGICDRYDYDCGNLTELIQHNVGVFFVTLLFSVLTYKLRDEIFQAWLSAALWFVPIIMLVTFLINAQSGNGGTGISGVAAGAFDFLVLFTLYTIFILTSLIKIFLASRKINQSSH